MLIELSNRVEGELAAWNVKSAEGEEEETDAAKAVVDARRTACKVWREANAVQRRMGGLEGREREWFSIGV